MNDECHSSSASDSAQSQIRQNILTMETIAAPLSMNHLNYDCRLEWDSQLSALDDFVVVCKCLSLIPSFPNVLTVTLPFISRSFQTQQLHQLNPSLAPSQCAARALATMSLKQTFLSFPTLHSIITTTPHTHSISRTPATHDIKDHLHRID